ncbi:BlaI/MecI/CopY family transcriptional regulator [Chryseobacterium sp. GMJ5]|uniref:BlaI/MecI/CopY family transcriptional regulator n=1 Tax=Chryseobacterium gilvum TaxID=2976534 RepID=A0ABT2VUC2_9FLAO|nr:BlaI/MecI/CopY family transcriptional regulator [Chryseobacterium gilvum]MCU7613601.1 BlaI/MecI/CopY family transcriptional regulator [Chryseobacterium gilvum]
MKISHLTSAEENLMKLFWTLQSFYLKDVMEKHTEPKPHQNTVSTYLKILVEKGYLSTIREGRIFKYTVLVPIDEYKKFLLNELCEQFFNQSGRELAAFLLKESLISQDDIKTYFDVPINTKPKKVKKPKLEYAEEILNPKKGKGRKKKKKKE